MHALSKTQAKAGSKASHLFPISMIGDTHAHWEHTGTVGLTIYLQYILTSNHGCVKGAVIERRQHQLCRMAGFPPPVTFSVFDI